MRDIIHLLTGDEGFPPSLDSMVGNYVSKLKMHLETMVWEATNSISGAEAANVVATYEKLSEPGKLHLLLSPALYETLKAFRSAGSADSFQAVAKLVRDEFAVSTGEAPDVSDDVSEVWAPMGDHAIRRDASGWTRYDADKIDGLLTVDFDSPYARVVRPDSPLMYLLPEDFTVDERSSVATKANEAFRYIDRVSPTFSHLVRNFSRAIRMRKAESQDSFGAEHVTSTIGEIRQINVHRADVTVFRLAESILHESVHNLLSTYEFLEHPFVLLSDHRQYRPVSPWTGNPIPVPSLCHAVFVWFALFEFAVLELRQPDLEPERRADIISRRNHYAGGFVAPSRLTESLRGLQQYHVSLLPAIDSVQALVRSQYANLQSGGRPVAMGAA